MKAFRRLVVLCLGLLLLAMAPVLDSRAALAVPAPDQSQATLTVLAGTATVIASASGEAHPAVSGEIVGAGQRIITDTPGQVLLTFFDGSELELTDGTEMLLESLQPTDGGGMLIQIGISTGIAIHRVSLLAGDSSYQVQTPNTTALVRGTRFSTQVLRDRLSGLVINEEIAVEDGVVEVQIRSQTRSVGPGERIRVVPSAGGIEIVGDDPGIVVEPNAPPLSIGGALSLTVSERIASTDTNLYEVHFDNPVVEAARGRLNYTWVLDLKGSDCNRLIDQLVVGPEAYQAAWSHLACAHGPNEEIVVFVNVNETGESVAVRAPAIVPGVYRP